MCAQQAIAHPQIVLFVGKKVRVQSLPIIVRQVFAFGP